MSKIVVSLHGIRTRGVWQKVLAPVLARNGFVPYLLDYGNFKLLPFLTPWSRKRKLRWLVDQLTPIYETENVNRVSIIAHSFGSYLTSALIEGYPEFRFDKVIFAGSIVRRNFAWSEYFRTGRVNLVRNDYGRLDFWPSVAKRLVNEAGDSGRSGFDTDAMDADTRDCLINVKFTTHGHSDYFHIKHYTEHWIPTLKRTLVARDDTRAITEKIDLIVQYAASELKVDIENLRANIFAENGQARLEIPPGLHYNMNDPEELKITMDIGTGCAGTAYARRQPTVAIKGEQRWGDHRLPEAALAHLNPELCWVVGMPITDPVTGVMLGTLNLDGLRTPKGLDELYHLSFSLYEPVQELASLIRKRV